MQLLRLCHLHRDLMLNTVILSAAGSPVYLVRILLPCRRD